MPRTPFDQLCDLERVAARGQPLVPLAEQLLELLAIPDPYQRSRIVRLLGNALCQPMGQAAADGGTAGQDPLARLTATLVRSLGDADYWDDGDWEYRIECSVGKVAAETLATLPAEQLQALVPTWQGLIRGELGDTGIAPSQLAHARSNALWLARCVAERTDVPFASALVPLLLELLGDPEFGSMASLILSRLAPQDA